MLPLMQLWLDLRPKDPNNTSPLPRSFSEPPDEIVAHAGTCAAFVMEALDLIGADVTAIRKEVCAMTTQAKAKAQRSMPQPQGD